MSMAWEPDRRSNFSPPAHLCAVTYMTEISLIVTLNNQFHLTFSVSVQALTHVHPLYGWMHLTDNFFLGFSNKMMYHTGLFFRYCMEQRLDEKSARLQMWFQKREQVYTNIYKKVKLLVR